MMYEQRDVVLIPFPYSDLSGAKQRPALIISNKKVNKDEDRICCLITSNPTSEGIKIAKEHFETGNLPFQSWAKPHRLFTIHERIIRKRLCRVTEALHNAIIDYINKFLKLD